MTGGQTAISVNTLRHILVHLDLLWYENLPLPLEHYWLYSLYTL